ncbi:MAG TPA: NAD(P)-dependent oxidoreductase [Candidatus Nanoarchaeia archaeon]|nr:NAD(P)-dependent oxidoreductase [Candidatus Nanoarchaeia archaeon]
MKILITGGAGYIGCVLTTHLLNRSYDITVLDNLDHKQTALIGLCSQEKFNFILGDVRDKELMEKLVPQFEVIIPLAAIVGAPACSRRKHDAQTINYEAIKLLSEIVQPHQKIIYPTSNSGYGTKSGDTFCTEETPLEPISLYGVTKVEGERVLLNTGKAVTLRLATVFGTSPRMRTDLLVNDLVQRAIFDRCLVLFEEHFKRNYIHIQDVARCFEHCILNFENMRGKAYNVGLEEANLSKRELAEKIKEHIPGVVIISEEFAQDPDKRNYVVSNQKLYATGFRPQYTIDFGIKELIKAYKILGNVKLGNG